ncbi:hypothetical protein A6X21_04320 [Planctopirus hydrillae]|uniref:Uncharacterized protein n=1 Tax=Planctopirus hydrillae TaxID=1841610 RepID=A0A1C3ENS2_9PLAN|nr:hypothetical protein A6X21_04320 [Planctopirus hydrillae]
MPHHQVNWQKQAHRSSIRSAITIMGVGITAEGLMAEGIMEDLRETPYRFPSTQGESALGITGAATILPFTAGQSMVGRFTEVQFINLIRRFIGLSLRSMWLPAHGTPAVAGK